MTAAQIKDARQSFRLDHAAMDLAALEAQGIITADEARQILGITPPDPETPPEPGCDRCRGKFVGEIHVNVHSELSPYAAFRTPR